MATSPVAPISSTRRRAASLPCSEKSFPTLVKAGSGDGGVEDHHWNSRFPGGSHGRHVCDDVDGIDEDAGRVRRSDLREQGVLQRDAGLRRRHVVDRDLATQLLLQWLRACARAPRRTSSNQGCATLGMITKRHVSRWSSMAVVLFPCGRPAVIVTVSSSSRRSHDGWAKRWINPSASPLSDHGRWQIAGSLASRNAERHACGRRLSSTRRCWSSSPALRTCVIPPPVRRKCPATLMSVRHCPRPRASRSPPVVISRHGVSSLPVASRSD